MDSAMAGAAATPGACAPGYGLDTGCAAGFDRITHGRFGNTLAVAQNPILHLR